MGSSKQASDYAVTANFVINHIKKTFKYGQDISDALRNLELHDTDKWYTELKVSQQQKQSEREREDRQFNKLYKVELDQSVRRVRIFEANLVKAYALLWERCAYAMQNKIQTRSEFESKIFDDPIELLKAIKEHALHFDQSQYFMSIIANSVRTFFGTVQREKESLAEYTRRFRTAKDVMESHLGEPFSMLKIVESHEDYDAKDTKKISEIRRESADQLYAFIHLENAGQSKYSQVLKNLNYEQSLGNNEYPKDIATTTTVLSRHQYETKKKHEDKKKPYSNKNDKDDPITLSFAQMEGRCYCCGKANHRSDKYRLREKIPNKAKAEEDSQSHAQLAETSIK